MPPKNYRYAPRRSPWPRFLAAGFGFLMLMVVGVGGTLWLLGVPLNPFATVQKENPYMVRIPINAQPIAAYTRVDRSHLLNPTTRTLMYQQVLPESSIGMSITGIDQSGTHVQGRVASVKNVSNQVVFVVEPGREVRQAQAIELGGAMMNVNGIIGRVVKRDKRPGLGFQESTFFPQGTPEGIAGATPSGMRALTLDATKLTGVYALNAGDQIDLMASLSVDANSDQAHLSAITGQKTSNSKVADSTEPYLLAQKAIVLKPVYIRNEASTTASLMQGNRVQNVPKYEVAIAVQPDDLIPLQRAINQSLSIICVAHSMRPVDQTVAAEKNVDDESLMVPVTVHPVLAYHVVTRDTFVSQATRSLKMESISRSEVAKLNIITSIDEALGAIAKHDIPAGRYLQRSDLLNGPPGQSVSPSITSRNSPASSQKRTPNPSGEQFVSTMQSPSPDTGASATVVGDRPAITRFVPPGRTAFAIPWNRIYGSEHLQIGDSIDLLVSYSLESNDEEEETETRADGTVIVRRTDSLAVRETERTWGASFGFRAEPWFVASDALVIAPVGFPAPASALRTLGDAINQSRAADNDRNRFTGPPVIIAVEDRDVEAVAAALSTRDALFSVGFHSHDSVSSSLAGNSKQIVVASEPLSPYQELSETIWQGNRRRITTKIVSSEDPRFDDAILADEIHRYYGRVMARAKARGDFLSTDDFLSPGTKPGLAAGVPSGHTFFPIADREIEGLDSFLAEDHIAILLRGVVKPVEGLETIGVDFSRPVSTVIVEDAKIARSSLGGQTVLSIADKDLAALQAAIARSQTDREQNGRSHLIAVVRARKDASHSESIVSDRIPAYDPLANVRFTESIVGGKRTVKAFAGVKPQ